MPNRTTDQKCARALQAETGKSYQQCLNEVRAMKAAKQPEPAPLPAPRTSGLFSHA